MAYTNTNTAGLSLAEKFADFRAQWAEASAKRKVFRTTVAELETLSSRELADLGISRASIKAVAYEAAYGK
ncbi:DUF1127 domain-containing protein [Yoonia sp. R2331]|uniref:DUF1127 domain-containing protein n=1 Tax=Yoonia sp. R2331 TaxID=3237238 RepID=UPI0034E38F94